MLPEWFNQLGVMQWPLAICAIIAVAICLDRAVFFIKASTDKSYELQQLGEQLQAYHALPKTLRDEMAALMLSNLEPRYYQGLKLLRLIGTMSPMLGLLGTILGIIHAFKTIAAQTGPVTANLIADGLWVAMLTTAAGLMIALPILLLAYLFRHLGERQLTAYCRHLNQLSMQMAMSDAQNEADKNIVKTSPRQVA